jgi:hypothetical protein
MLLLFLAVPASAADVLALQISGAINPATDDLVLSAIQEADGKGYQALILYLNTPGGGLEETRQSWTTSQAPRFLSLAMSILRAPLPGLQELSYFLDLTSQRWHLMP